MKRISKWQLKNKLASELDGFAKQSADVREVSISTPGHCPNELWLAIEDWGKGASGPYKDPDISATKRAVRAWLLSRGYDLVWIGDGDGAVGHIEQFEIQEFYPNKTEDIFVSAENVRPVRAYYRGTLLARDRVSAVETCGDFTKWPRDAGETLLARGSDNQYTRAAARAVCTLVGIEG